MGSRIAATIVLVAGVAVLAWVGLRSDGDGQAVAPAVVPEATEAATAPTSNGAPSDTALPDAATSDAATSEVAIAVSPTAEPPTPVPDPAVADPEGDPPENYGPRRSLVELDGWLNTDITSLDDLDGQVVIVEMWTFGCSNCKARIPYNQAYYEEFRDQGFEIVGVHAPEFSYEADVANIEKALVDLGVTWPVALDTNKLNFREWQSGTTSYWPRTYVIDQNGDVRYDHIGEGKYEELRETIRFLLDHPPPPANT